MKHVSTALILAALALSGCVSVREGATAEINLSVWKSNAGQSNAVEQATDANAKVYTLP